MRGWTGTLEGAIRADRALPWAMMALGALGVYLVGFDQGYFLFPLAGEAALAQNWLHELFHDARHIGAFMCH